MKKEQLCLDIVGLAGACSYALDCIEAELVKVKNKHGKRVAYISVCMLHIGQSGEMLCKILPYALCCTITL